MKQLLWSRGETMPVPLMEEELLTADSHALRRLWRGFMTARSFVGVVLLLLQILGFALGQAVQPTALALSAAYLAMALAGARLVVPHPPMRHFGAAWLATVGIDIATFALLQSLQSGSINYTPLFALPVLTCAVLGTVSVGLGTTAMVTLLLLADAGWHWVRDPGDSSTRFVQAALTGTGLFVVALLAHQLALRLAREETLATRSHNAARMHAQVNDLVIETLTEGVLVIDAAGLVHSANPAAEVVLGYGLADLALPFSLATYPAWQPLAALARMTFSRRSEQSAELPIAQFRGAAREIRVRTRLTPMDDAGIDSLCVMFLQDLRELEARIRTEKLAAMGRMSAAVAHEIRNPLAAIAQASALLNEDLTDPAHRRLTDMVEHNARRLGRIVDEVLDVARVRQQRTMPPEERITLDATVRTLAEEWVRQSQHQGVLLMLGTGSLEVHFDPEHLRRILVNLLDNAARYAGDREGSIQVTTDTAANDRRATLQVWSDGAPLDAAVHRHLFEPFFSSESRSSGLGLYICRELCERHGGSIGYERRPLGAVGAEGNAFTVSFLRVGTQ